MDRLMYREIRATSGPDSSGDYRFEQPQSVTSDDMKAAGLRLIYSNIWYSKQPVVKVQAMDGRAAAASCR
jgi:hypothetical protein